jgi:hypothetical protein
MAVIFVKELWAGRTGDVDDTFKRDYRRLFQAHTNNKGDGPVLVRAGLGISIWSSYQSYLTGELDGASLCNKIECEQAEDSPFLWRVTVSYSTEVTEQAQQAEDPLQEPKDISWDTESYQKAVEQDRAGNAICNSALDPFDPPPTIDDSRLTLTIERNEAIDNPTRMKDYQDAVNSDTFYGFPAGEWKVAQMSCKRQYRNNVFFWRWVYKFHHRVEGWKLKLLDAGYRTWTLPDGWKDILSKGVPIQQPALLDGTGKQLPHGNPPVWMQLPNGWVVYREQPFAALNLE